MRRWYELSAARLGRRPALHRAGLAALDAHLALVARAPTIEAFSAALAHGGHATALARAHQADRYAAELALARALGDAAAATAAAATLAALAAEGDAAFAAACAGARDPGTAAIGELASRLVDAAIDLACDPDAERREEHRRRARGTWALLRALDPGFGLARLAAPPYAHRIPFDAPIALAELIGAALGDPADLDGAPPPPMPAPPPPPRFDGIAALAIDGWPAVACDLDVLAREIDELARGAGVAAAQAAAVAALAAQRAIAAAWDEPALVRLADEALAGVAAAVSDLEVQAWLGWHAAVAAIERAWTLALVQAALWPAVAALIAPAAARPAAVTAARLLHADPIAALRAPAIERALVRQVLEAGQGFDEARPTAGPGGAHVALLRRAGAEHGARAIQDAIRRGAPVPDLAAVARRFPDAAALEAEVAAALVACGAPRGGDGRVVLWGRTVPLAAVDGVVAGVPRPRPEAL